MLQQTTCKKCNEPVGALEYGGYYSCRNPNMDCILSHYCETCARRLNYTCSDCGGRIVCVDNTPPGGYKHKGNDLLL